MLRLDATHLFLCLLKCLLDCLSSCRAAHQRLVAHSEEVAFNDPPGGAAEQLILNQHLARLITFSRLSSFQRFLQQVGCAVFLKCSAAESVMRNAGLLGVVCCALSTSSRY
jgi:hypothetical protein